MGPVEGKPRPMGSGDRPQRASRPGSLGERGMTVTAEEMTNVSFEIVAYSGDARSKLLLALQKTKAGELDEARALVSEAQECLNDAHRAQTSLLTAEARGESLEIGFISVHAQDHLMTTLLLKDIISTLFDIYRTR